MSIVCRQRRFSSNAGERSRRTVSPISPSAANCLQVRVSIITTASVASSEQREQSPAPAPSLTDRGVYPYLPMAPNAAWTILGEVDLLKVSFNVQNIVNFVMDVSGEFNVYKNPCNNCC